MPNIRRRGSIGHGRSYLKGHVSTEQKERRNLVKERLFGDGDPFDDDDIPLPPIQRRSISLSPHYMMNNRKEMHSRKELHSRTEQEMSLRTDASNKLKSSRRPSRRFSLGKKRKSKRRSNSSASTVATMASMASSEDGIRLSEKEAIMDKAIQRVADRKKKLSPRTKSHEMSSSDEEEEDESSVGLITRGLRRLERFYEDSL